MSAITDPWLNTPTILSLRRILLHLAHVNAIVVYPEDVVGNPLEAEIVVRWIGCRMGAGSEPEPEKYGPDDLIVHLGDEPPHALVSAGRLRVPVSDPDVFREPDYSADQSRSGNVVYLGRYRDYGLPVDDFLAGATVVTRGEAKAPAELAELYRRSSLFFTYEPTAASLDALLCGCPTVYLPSPLNEGMGPPAHGCAIGAGEADVARARETVGLAIEAYKSDVAGFEAELRRFIDMTQERAAGRAQ